MVALSESDRAWWLRPEGDRDAEDIRAHEKLQAVIKSVADSQDARRRACMVYASMYGADQTLAALLGMGSKMSAAQTGPRAESNLSLNVTRNCIDAATSRVASKGQPRLTYATEGADPEKQENAKKLELGVEGVFYRTGMDDKCTDGFSNGCVFGDGDVRIEADHDAGEVCVEVMLPMQLIVDEETDLYNGCPRSWYVITPIDKYVLAWKYRDEPEKAEMIERLSSDTANTIDHGWQMRGLSVYQYEGWHRPSGPGAPDGRYVKGVSNVTLVDRVWDGGRTGRPPIATYQWSKSKGGYYGQGIAEQGRGIQTEINALVRQIQNGHHLVTGRWMVEGNSKVIAAHINNDLSSILRYTGAKPEYIVPTIIAPEMYQHLWNLKTQYFLLAGMNEQTVSAVKPAGLNSGEAQREYRDSQTETLLEKGKRYEKFVRECGQLCTDAAKELADKGAYEVRANNDDGFETINWKDLPDVDGFQLRVAPTSTLPGTPSGKIDYAYDLLKLGDFDTSDIMEIVGQPDMLQKTRLKLASRKLTEKRVGEMLRLGKPWAPPAYLNLAEAFAVANDMLCLAESKDVDDGRLQLVRDFLVACVKTKQLSMPQAPPPVMAPGAPGLMAPGSAAPTPGAAAAPSLPAVPKAAA